MRAEGGTRTQPGGFTMTLMRRHSPLADVVTVRDAMERLFDERFLTPIWPWNGERQATPALDLYATPEAVVATIALPGVKSGRRRRHDRRRHRHGPGLVPGGEGDDRGRLRPQELSRGSFSRTFAVPTAVKAEAATASFNDGLLTVTLPKTEEVKPKHVKIEVSG